jgi:hypothetical protein
MRVSDIRLDTSPLATHRTSLRAQVTYDKKAIASEVYWFDVPERYGEQLSQSGNAWLAYLIPLAADLGEPLRISKPIDRTLMINVQRLVRIWKSWYPRLHEVPIEADVVDTEPPTRAGRTGAFFSGGADAWFTLLWHTSNPGGSTTSEIDDLISVWGLDIALDNPQGFRRMRGLLQEAAAQFNMEPLDVATNLRDTYWWRRWVWGPVGHGSALASIGLALEGRYKELLIPGTHRYDDLVPWGSHPLTDPLLSTRWTKIVHDGAGFNRWEKIEIVVKCELAMRTLQVCWETGSYENCEACAKCYRTMTALMLLGTLDRCSTFHASTVEPARLAKVFSPDAGARAFVRELRELAVHKGRTDIAGALDRSLRHSRRLAVCMKFVRFARATPILSRWANPVERWLLADSLV